MPWLRLVLPLHSPRLLLSLLGLLLWAVAPLPLFSGEHAELREEGLVGRVESVVTWESVLVQTDRFDEQGRLIERIQ